MVLINYNATHNTYKYNGRGEEFYTYNKFNRKIQVSFKIAAQTRHEMKPIYQKLNFLAAQTAPNYSLEGRIRTPFHTMTIGDWFQSIPGMITGVSLKWQKDYPWEIALDRKPHPTRQARNPKNLDNFEERPRIEGEDKEMLILPHVLDVSLSFQPVHDFTPNNDISSPFIGINGNINTTNWIEPPSFVHKEYGKIERLTGIEGFFRDTTDETSVTGNGLEYLVPDVGEFLEFIHKTKTNVVDNSLPRL